jgi:hypothetical protein
MASLLFDWAAAGEEGCKGRVIPAGDLILM